MRLARLRFAILLAALAIGAIGLRGQTGTNAPWDRAPASGLDPEFELGLASAITPAELGLVRCGDAYLAHHPWHQLRFLFRDGGLTVTPPLSGPDASADCEPGLGVQAESNWREPQWPEPPWRWGLRLLGYAAVADGADLAAAGGLELEPPQVAVDGQRLRLDRGALIEWYENRATGLKQGFTLRRPPRPDAAEQLVLRLALEGGLHALWEQPGRSLAFYTPAGDYALSYRDLQVLDARGRSLPSRLVLKPNQGAGAQGRAPEWLEIRIDATGARWPLTVDPVLFSEQRISSLGGEGGDFFGWSLALSGDRALVGAWLDDARARDAGAAYLFQKASSGWRLEAKLTAADAQAGDFFGAAVAIDGDRLLIGAPLAGEAAYFRGDTGAAYLFERQGGRWRQQQKLVPKRAASGDLFGRAVALEGETAAIGAYGDRDNGMSSGAVYIFSQGADGWEEQAKLKASDGRTDDRFGAALALSGGRVLIGAYRHDSSGEDAGAAYIFARDGDAWAQQAKLTSAKPQPLGFFGFSVAFSGDSVLIGAWGEQDASQGGAAYLFSSSGGRWRLRQRLVGKPVGGRFGFSVALDKRHALVGAYLDDAHPGGTGAAYLYRRAKGQLRKQATLTGEVRDDGFGVSVALDEGLALVGAVLDGHALSAGRVWVFAPTQDRWRSQTALSAPAQTLSDRFGVAVAISEQFALIGAPKANTEQAELAGAAFLFERGLQHLGRHEVLIAEYGEIGDAFGRAVALSENRVFVGAPSADAGGLETGLVYVLARGKQGWRLEALLRPQDGGVRSRFGQAIAADGDRLLVGAPGDEEAASGAGAAYLFQRNAKGWILQAKLMAGDAAADQQFGAAVALHRNRALIGAARDRTHGRNAGAAYLVTKGEGGWRTQQKLLPADPKKQQHFGYAVSLGERHALIGAWGDDTGGHQAGAVYVFGPTSDIGPTSDPTSDPWDQQAKLTPAEAGARLGVAVALSGPMAVAGAYGRNDVGEQIGLIYVLKEGTQGWMAEAKLAAGLAHPGFGLAVALSGDGALIGTGLADETGSARFVRIQIDSDADGVADPIDNCPLIANIDQRDSNQDAIGDACEAPTTPVRADQDQSVLRPTEQIDEALLAKDVTDVKADAD